MNRHAWLLMAVVVGVGACSVDTATTATSLPTPASGPATTDGSSPTSTAAGTNTSKSGAGSSTTRGAKQPSDLPAVPSDWVEQEVTFPTVLGTFHGTYTHPRDGASWPAALLIGGSGATDRDGNSVGAPGMNTLLAVGRWLAADGVASLRYDKLGSGATGAGNLTPATAGSVTAEDYLTANAQALEFLSQQKGVVKERLSVLGHSEGGAFALLLAAGRHGAALTTPAIHAVAALEPLAVPILDVIDREVGQQIDQAVAANAMTKSAATAMRTALNSAIVAVRAGEPVPADLPPQLATLFSPAAVTYLRTMDAIDPRAVAAGVPAGTPVLLSCSSADIQVTCADVTQLLAPLRTARAQPTLYAAADMAHTLKIDTSKNPANYGADLPFSPALRAALASWSRT